NTLTPRYDPKPYTVCEIKGIQVKAKREDHIIVRNASFFKHFLESSTHPDIPEINPHISNTPAPIPCTSYAEVPEDHNQEHEDHNQEYEDQNQGHEPQEISLRPVNLGGGGGGGPIGGYNAKNLIPQTTLQRKKSMPDFQELPRATGPMSREEVSALGSARREEVRRQADRAERLRANPLLYLVSPEVKVSQCK
ncbi:hypothetical protein QE152_g33895, partial [Popillia japonica]